MLWWERRANFLCWLLEQWGTINFLYLTFNRADDDLLGRAKVLFIRYQISAWTQHSSILIPVFWQHFQYNSTTALAKDADTMRPYYVFLMNCVKLYKSLLVCCVCPMTRDRTTNQEWYFVPLFAGTFQLESNHFAVPQTLWNSTLDWRTDSTVFANNAGDHFIKIPAWWNSEHSTYRMTLQRDPHAEFQTPLACLKEHSFYFLRKPSISKLEVWIARLCTVL